MKKKVKYIFAGVLGAAIGFSLALGWVLCHCEMECFWNPSIDTRYANGYSEDTFQSLKVGMSRSDVDLVMCAPLITHTNPNGTVSIWYTSDGNAPFGDFAWFGRILLISNDAVAHIDARMYYD